MPRRLGTLQVLHEVDDSYKYRLGTEIRLAAQVVCGQNARSTILPSQQRVRDRDALFQCL